MVLKVARGCEFKAGLRHPMTSKTLCLPSSKWAPFSNQGRIRQRNERDGRHFSFAVPKIQWNSNPNCPYG